jgi:RNA polymerase sigma factor (TIGR02999 family)
MTALVNEAYMRLVNCTRMQLQNRAHLSAVSAMVMRRVLVEPARRHSSKRGGAAPDVSLDEAATIGNARTPDLVALDDALEALARLDDRKAEIVALCFCSGLTVDKVAEVLRVSPATVTRDCRSPKAWLYRELPPGHANGSRTLGRGR